MKKIFISVLATIAVLAGGYYFALPSLGNVTEFNSPCTLSGSPATTSPIYMTAGKATTTIACNLGGSLGTGVSSASTNFYFTASSSPLSTLVVLVQYSNNNFQDTYEDRVVIGTATSTQISGGQKLYVYNEAATSTNYINGGTNATSTGSFEIPNPHRAKYIRLILTAPVGSSPFAVWAEISPKKERQ